MKHRHTVKKHLINVLKGVGQNLNESKESETQRKRVEEALPTGEQRIRHLADLLTEAVYEIDLEGKLAFANQRAFQLTGYSQEDFAKGVNVLQMFIPEDQKRTKDNMARIVAGEDLGFTEYTMQRKDGSTLLVMVHSAPIVHESKVVGLRGIAIDISGLKEVERKIRTLTSAVEQSIDGIAIGDLEPKLIYVNEAFARMHDYSPEEMIGMNVVNLHNEEQMGDLKRGLHQIRTQGSWTGEIGHIRKDGTPFPTYMSVTLLKDDNGKPTGILAVARDVTEHKRAEQALGASEERYRTLFEGCRDAIFITTRDGKFVDVNKSFLDLFGYSRRELAGLDAREAYVNPADRRKFQQEIEQKGSVRDFDVKLRKKDGTEMACLLTSTVRRDADGDVLGYEGIVRDITEHKQAEAKLLAYQGQLRFLASVLSMTEERERRRIAKDLHDCIGHALALCKIKLGALRESLSSTDHASDLEEIYELVEQAIQSARSLTFDLSPPVLHELGLEAAVEWLAERIQRQYGIPTHVEDDRQPKPLDDDVKIVLFQITRELLVNVAKHAQARNARVSIRRDCSDIKIRVEDDGVGFDSSEIVSSTTNTGGLGLFNIRERLNHIRGHLEIESEPGHGARVTIVAPLKPKKKMANGRLA